VKKITSNHISQKITRKESRMPKRKDRPEENSETRVNELDRPRRSFIEDTKDIMTVKGKDDGYVYRWVNDERGRVQRMMEAGYDVVQEDVSVGDANQLMDSGSNTTMTVDRVHGVKGILMRIRKEFVEEDRKARAKRIDRTEEQMLRDLKGADGRYGEYGEDHDVH
jgi:hypothetical protein